MGKIRLGVIGLGSISKSMLLLCKVTKGIRVTGICDIDQKKLDQQSKKFVKAKKYTDYRQLIRDDNVDCVYIALPHYLHYEVMMEAVKNKKHIFCEKPVTINSEQAKRLLTTAEANGVKIAVNYQYRYDNNCYTAIKAIQNGVIGKVNYVRCYVAWSRNDSYFQLAPWHGDKYKSGGGTLLTHGSHFLDIILWATDSRLDFFSVINRNYKFKYSQVEDFNAFQGVLSNGTVIQFSSNMTEKKERTSVLEFVGDKGSIVYKKGFGSNVKFYGVKYKRLKSGKFSLHPVQRSLKGFIDWLNHGNRHLCAGFESVRVLEEIEKIYKEGEKK